MSLTHKTPSRVLDNQHKYRARRSERLQSYEKSHNSLLALHSAIKIARGTSRAIPGIYASDDVYQATEKLVKWLLAGKPVSGKSATKQKALPVKER